MSAPTISIKDASLRKSFKTGTADGKLSHSDAVNLIRSVLDKGQVTRQEMTELRLIVDKSKTLSLRSRNLLAGFIQAVNDSIGDAKAVKVPEEAANLVCDFLLRSGGGQFPKFHRDQIGLELLMRLAKPGIIDQGTSSLCGPAAILFELASTKPTIFARFGIDLFEKGIASLGNIKIEPDTECKNFDPAFKKQPNGEYKREIAQADWMMAASIRDSENAFLDYETTGHELAGITLPSHLVKWFDAAGYSDIQNVTNLVLTKGSGTIDQVNEWQAKGYRVCLFIAANMLEGETQSHSSVTPDHWVVLQSPISNTKGYVSFRVFTWGEGARRVPLPPPHGIPLREVDFLKSFYGFVAAKP